MIMNVFKKTLIAGVVAGLPFAAAAEIAVAVGVNMDGGNVENFTGAAGVGESAVASSSAGSAIFTESATASAGATQMSNTISAGAIGGGYDHSSYVNIAGQVTDELIAGWVCDNWAALSAHFDSDAEFVTGSNWLGYTRDEVNGTVTVNGLTYDCQV